MNNRLKVVGFIKISVILPIIFTILSCNLPRNEKGELISRDQLTIIIGALVDLVFKPDISITSPGNGAKFEEGTTVEFWVSLSDFYKRHEPNTVQWSSSRDGILGTGRVITMSDLSVGVHRIQAEVCDEDGNFGNESAAREDSIQIEIYEKAEPHAIEDCIVPPDRYVWAYEDVETIFGTGGSAKGMPSCRANFVIRNNLGEDIFLTYYSVFDNNAMHTEVWKSRTLNADSVWTDRVTHTEYVDGSITYSEIRNILLLRNDSECMQFHDINKEIYWGAVAISIEKLPCP